MAKRNDWSEGDTLFLFHVLLSEPSKDLVTGSPRVLEMAGLLNRTPGSVHRKLEDIRSNSPSNLSKGNSGTHCAKMIEGIWFDLYSDYDRTIARIDDAYMTLCEDRGVESELSIDPEVPPGLDVPVEATYRDGQQVFRRMVANNFDRCCCITGIATPSLLVASHIKPWAGSTPLERTDFRNGLYLNRLHDGLFDRHLMTIDEDMRIEYAESVRQENVGDTFETFFGRYEGQRIRKPSCRRVDERYLAEHRRISHELWSRT